MEITLKFLKPLNDVVGQNELSVEVGNGTVESLLADLLNDHPKLAEEMLDEKGELDYRVNVILNDKPLNDLDVNLNDGDLLTLFIPISGG